MTSPTPIPSRRRRLSRLLALTATLAVAAYAFVFGVPPYPATRPAPTPGATTSILRLSGGGNLASAAFTTGPEWAVSYSFTCPPGGAFRVVEVGGSVNGVSIAEGTATGSATTYVGNAPGLHRFRIESECTWTLTVTDGEALPRETPGSAA